MKTRILVPIVAAVLGVSFSACQQKENDPGIKPVTVATQPAESVTEVPRNTKVEFTFSEEMDPSTINSSSFHLKGSNMVPGTVSYYEKTATFTPSGTLAANCIYTATVTNDVRDINGNPLDAPAEWSFRTGGNTSPVAVVNLGSSGAYTVLAATSIHSEGTTKVTGNMGVSSFTSNITGFDLTITNTYATSGQVDGTVYSSEMAAPVPDNLGIAEETMMVAYNDAASRKSADFEEFGDGNIGDKTLVAGVYRWAHGVTMPRDIIISGSANDVWVFQIAGDLNAGSTVNVILNGGAQAKNIFWQVSGETTIGTNSHFEGSIISIKNVTLQENSSLNGRIMTKAAVILDNNTITAPQ